MKDLFYVEWTNKINNETRRVEGDYVSCVVVYSALTSEEDVDQVTGPLPVVDNTKYYVEWTYTRNGRQGYVEGSREECKRVELILRSMDIGIGEVKGPVPINMDA